MVCIFAVGFLVLTVLSWPMEQFNISAPFLDIFSPPIRRYLPVTFLEIGTLTTSDIVAVNGVPTNKTATNTTIKYEEILLQGLITITGKGGISVQNNLDLEATLSVNETLLGHKVSKVRLTPLGATTPSLTPTPAGVIIAVAFNLARANETEWTTFGKIPIVYNQEGTYYMQISIDNYTAVSSSFLTISPETVTVSARTNSLLVSLTWAILLFAVLELRVEENGCKCKNCQQQSNQHRE